MARTRRGEDKGGDPLVATEDPHQHLPPKKKRRARKPSNCVEADAVAVAAVAADAAIDQPEPVFHLQDLADLVRGNCPTQRQCQQDP